MLWLTVCYSTEQMRFFKYCNRLVCSTKNGTEIILDTRRLYLSTKCQFIFYCQIPELYLYLSVTCQIMF
jgi:hypothetical protein